MKYIIKKKKHKCSCQEYYEEVLSFLFLQHHILARKQLKEQYYY